LKRLVITTKLTTENGTRTVRAGRLKEPGQKWTSNAKYGMPSSLESHLFQPSLARGYAETETDNIDVGSWAEKVATREPASESEPKVDARKSRRRHRQTERTLDQPESGTSRANQTNRATELDSETVRLHERLRREAREMLAQSELKRKKAGKHHHHHRCRSQVPESTDINEGVPEAVGYAPLGQRRGRRRSRTSPQTQPTGDAESGRPQEVDPEATLVDPKPTRAVSNDRRPHSAVDVASDTEPARPYLFQDRPSKKRSKQRPSKKHSHRPSVPRSGATTTRPSRSRGREGSFTDEWEYRYTSTKSKPKRSCFGSLF
jgi:hypothetical protein